MAAKMDVFDTNQNSGHQYSHELCVTPQAFDTALPGEYGL